MLKIRVSADGSEGVRATLSERARRLRGGERFWRPPRNVGPYAPNVIPSSVCSISPFESNVSMALGTSLGLITGFATM
jgi:hypothetical protein